MGGPSGLESHGTPQQRALLALTALGRPGGPPVCARGERAQRKGGAELHRAAPSTWTTLFASAAHAPLGAPRRHATIVPLHTQAPPSRGVNSLENPLEATASVAKLATV